MVCTHEDALYLGMGWHHWQARWWGWGERGREQDLLAKYHLRLEGFGILFLSMDPSVVAEDTQH